MSCSYRYIMRLLVWPLLFITVAMAGVIWLTQSLRFVDLILNRGLPAHTFFYLAILILPMVMSILLPVAMFIAVIFTYSKMTMDSELIVLRACGMSQGTLARPAISMAVLVALICYAVNLFFMPLAYREFKDLQFSIRNDYSSVLLQEGTFNNVVEGVTVYVRERKSDGELLGILVHDERIPDKPVTMMAERGALVHTPNGPRVVMANGNRQAIEKGREQQLSILYFDQYTLDFDTATQSGGVRWREARERYIDELFWPGDSADDIRARASLRAEGHQRLSSPLLTLAFTLIALAGLLAGEFNRRGQVRRILWATGAVAAVQITYLGAFNLSSTMPAAILMVYLIPVIAAASGLYVLLHHPVRRAAGDILARV